MKRLGHFENEHGELMIVMVEPVKGEKYILGDETDYKPVKIKDCILSDDEKFQIEAILSRSDKKWFKTNE